MVIPSAPPTQGILGAPRRLQVICPCPRTHLIAAQGLSFLPNMSHTRECQLCFGRAAHAGQVPFWLTSGGRSRKSGALLYTKRAASSSSSLSPPWSPVAVMPWSPATRRSVSFSRWSTSELSINNIELKLHALGQHQHETDWWKQSTCTFRSHTRSNTPGFNWGWVACVLSCCSTLH